MRFTLQVQPGLDDYRRTAVEGFQRCHNLGHIAHEPPGTGKTVVSGLKMEDLGVAPSHSATNRSFKQIRQFQEHLLVYKQPIHLYRGVHEKQHLHWHRKANDTVEYEIKSWALRPANQLQIHLSNRSKNFKRNYRHSSSPSAFTRESTRSSICKGSERSFMTIKRIMKTPTMTTMTTT